jgi:Protein of unknown function (DUF1203)
VAPRDAAPVRSACPKVASHGGATLPASRLDVLGKRIMSSFQLVGLDHATFEPLFRLPAEQLRLLGAVRCVATESPGFPCRISLEDAALGDELLLLPYEHQPAVSPYRSSGPIFVRRNSAQITLPPGVVPPYVTRRLISVRAYDDAHMMVAATVCDGTQVEREIEQYFAAAEISYIHLHNAKRGCFSCLVNRAS